MLSNEIFVYISLEEKNILVGKLWFHNRKGRESASDLKLLLAPGSSLGGARPKASVRDKDGSLAIAKFPCKDDSDDSLNIVLWEAVALTLAKTAGIITPQWRIENVLKNPVLIEKRFDRTTKSRIPFLSSMSMLGAADNETPSYLEIAYAISRYGSQPNKDLAELWRRIVFNVLLSNSDDHLRNHGFLYEHQKGWKLSPIYDINPTPTSIKPRILSTTIDFNNNEASLDLALSVIEDFRLTEEQAHGIVKDVVNAVTKWQKVAKQVGLKESDIEKISSCF
ncbi:MAG: HipA domain-containing protein [Endomicrobium sp.]|jgi:serine/threonine-protein kinase HipA|nr:HipA domain-containing protein [Endomicrobium sp.]